MARQSSVRYFESRGGFFTTYQGKQHALAMGEDDSKSMGPVWTAANLKFAQLMHMSVEEKSSDDMTVSALLTVYRRAVALKSASNAKLIGEFLETCLPHFGGVRISQLKPYHVEEWLTAMRKKGSGKVGQKGHRGWGDTRTSMAIDKLLTMFFWGVRKGMLTKSPIQRAQLDAPRERQRSRDVVITQDEYESMIRESNEHFKRLWAFMWHTGCRPQEARHAEAHNLDRDKKALVFRHDPKPGQYLHKNAKKTRKDRVIYLSDTMFGLVCSLADERPIGPLFTNRAGRQWKTNALTIQLTRLCAKCGLKKKVIPYSPRHSYATRWLLAGKSITLLAELLGNTPTMIQKHYAHLTTGHTILRDAANEFV